METKRKDKMMRIFSKFPLTNKQAKGRIQYITAFHVKLKSKVRRRVQWGV